MTFSIAIYTSRHSARDIQQNGSVMMSVILLNTTYKPLMLSVAMLSVVMLGAVAPFSVTLNSK